MKKQKVKAKTTDTTNEENELLVQAGGIVEDDEDIKSEFLNIVKTKRNSTDCKPAGVVDVIKIVKKEDPLIMTATQDAFSKWIIPYLHEKVGQLVTPWALLSVKDIQEAVDLEFGRTEYCMGEKSAWIGLTNYHITNFCHEVCVEAEKAVEAFIAEHADQLSTPKLIGQYMAYLIMPTSPGGNIALSPLFMWKVWKNSGAKRRGMFCHELIIQVMAEAHFMVLGPMNNLSTIPYPKGALLLTGQVVKHHCWSGFVFRP
ncbi:hypothetical protein EV421DRAFT_1902522 [Armillaria borealis]|uniref:Uncharacterized protein n=1 Tax=Armillaria borealis TaxID=47425 RepID=A0AA39JNE4_9AGAR|nr:hypothetical protein EV421DRAFT_1902522 [Armillaria borealis]